MGVLVAVERTEFEKGWTDLQRLHDEASALLGGLDRLGLFQASAYVSMAIDVMRRQHPALHSSEGNNRTSG